jgi:hypothetical protein
MQVFKVSQAQAAHKTYKDHGKNFSDGETSRVGPVNVWSGKIIEQI